MSSNNNSTLRKETSNITLNVSDINIYINVNKANNNVVQVNATSIMPEQAEPPIVSIPIYDMTYESTLCIDDDNNDGVEGNE